jgi:hypothetical protein
VIELLRDHDLAPIADPQPANRHQVGRRAIDEQPGIIGERPCGFEPQIAVLGLSPMRRRMKAEHHEDVREILRKTGKRKIIENSPVDDFWGIGPEGVGKNIVGEIWMKIRDDLLHISS